MAAEKAKKKESAGGPAKLAANLTKDPQKQKALEAAMEQIERQFGKGAIMRLGQSELEDIEAIPTGSLTLDIALGIGGLPMGRIIEIFGPESSGKTTLTLELIAQAQKKGKVCAFIDAEHALDPVYAKRLGVQIEDVFISQPDTGEQALDICETLVRSNAVDVIIIDSVAALVPKAEIEGDMGDNHVGLQARLMSQALRKLTGTIKQANCMVVFINQLRMKIGVMFGSPETTTGGNALKYYASVRLDIRKSTVIKEKDQPIGNETKVKVVKNKVAPPFKQANFQILFNYGIAKNGELLDLGVQAKIVDKTGAWFGYNGAKIGQGKVNAMRYLDEHPEVADEIEEKIREYYKNSSDYADTVEIGTAAPADDLDAASLPDLDDEDLITEIPDDL
ncbi:Recombinase A [Anaerobiospirillum thomasii]|uniref:Protein RecA n=2 Tax=Anaerobiospirillum thomasii TaxID=179995 RepID=A0A2X0WQJ2_9GAMM|nr:recombinase RecA [Anaerobiospirillum thomasii]SPT68842.1 Recombinase A [Anaerobiospirillum thomasii]SPT71068.1 Recombinase A [Anaerobiospirillum thomasii]